MRNKNLTTYPLSGYINQFKTGLPYEWLRQNWFKLTLIICAVSIMLVKDFSLQMNVKAPVSMLDTKAESEMEMTSSGWLAKGRQMGAHLIGAMANPVRQESELVVHDVQEESIQKAGFDNLGNTYSNMTYDKEKKTSSQQSKKLVKQKAYVQRFVSVAQAEMKKFGIPASITLAQGLIESNAGESRLSREINNHFGMKCFSRKCKKGHCKNFTDDTHKDFFKAFGSAWESYRAHSKMLEGKRYRNLKKHGKDYKAWAHGLKKAGYATDPMYAEKLIRLIESLNLTQYD